MIKTDLAKLIARELPLFSAQDLQLGVQEIMRCLANSICKDERIEIRDFGSFVLHHYKPRLARNPKIGKKIKITATALPHFKPGKGLAEAINANRHIKIKDID